MRTVRSLPLAVGCILALAATLAAERSARAQEAPPPAEPVADEGGGAAADDATADLAADAPRCSGTGIEGVVRDAESGETLIEAPVVVVGRGRRSLTDYDGRFALDLPPGTYSLRSYYDLYQPTRVDDVVVTRGHCARVEITLSAETSMAEEVVIEVRAERGTAASQLRLRRETPAVQDGVSGDEIRRAPDSSAADAARRVVGVTIRDDYLYVRGLGGRYVTTLLNGVALPATDPDVPGVQLDIFPSSVLESLTIRKTFTPEVPGDWAGGLMNVSSQSFPNDFTLRLSGSFGVNTATSFQPVYGYRGGDTDALGFDDGTRAMPAAIAGSGGNLEEIGLSMDQVDALSLSLANTWSLQRRTAWPNFSLGGSVGDTIDVDGHLVGFLVMAGYRYSERAAPDVLRSVRIAGEGDEQVVSLREGLTQEGLERHVQLSALATVTVELTGGHDVTFNGLFSQNAEDFTGRVQGLSETAGAPIDAFRFAWLERTLVFGQLLGEHTGLPGGARLDWNGYLGLGERRQPDLRDMLYVIPGDEIPRWAPSSLSGTRFYSDLDDLTYGVGSNLTIPISTVTMRVGGLFRQTERALDARRFGWQSRAGSPPDCREQTPRLLFSAEEINRCTRLRELTRQSDGYDATQTTVAAYGSLEWRPLREVRIFGGVRAESFRQVVTSSTPFATQTPDATLSDTRRTDVDLMPSITGAIEVFPEMFVRASYAGTVARPQVRELAPFVFVDFIRRRAITGNPLLERTYVHQLDVRWEWFPSAAEVLAVSGFVKLFESPIESTITNEAGDITYQNIESAQNFGAEIEARTHLGHLTPELDWITLGANVTLVYSRAVLGEAVRRLSTSLERPLAGQAPWVINLALGLSPPDTNLSLNVYYNVFGERLEDVGQQGLPDVYRQPFHSLDAAISYSPTPEIRIQLTAANVLFQRLELTQGGFAVLGQNPGTTFSLGLGYSP